MHCIYMNFFYTGELTAHCMGPNKVAYCELYDHRDGTFTLNVKPQEPGRHILQIKYGGEHVPGKYYLPVLSCRVLLRSALKYSVHCIFLYTDY